MGQDLTINSKDNQVSYEGSTKDWTITIADTGHSEPRWKDISRRARLVADGTGLETLKGFTLLVGSNPTPSALDLDEIYAHE